MKKFICAFTLAMSVFLLAACVSEADVEAARNEGYKAGYADCKDEYTNATQKAYSSGYDWGYNKGYDAGYEDGKEEAGTPKTNTVYVNADYDEIYDMGYEDGWSDARYELENELRDEGYSYGYEDGYSDARSKYDSDY